MGSVIGSPAHLRAINERAALYALLREGPLSRLELDRATGLSKPAAAELLSRLESAGLVRRSGLRAGSGPGPQAQLWSANVAAGFAAGIDVTPTAIDVAVCDLAGTVVAEAKVPVRGSAPPKDPAGAIRAALQQAVTPVSSVSIGDIAQVVLGIQGSVDPVTGHLEYAAHLPRWTGFALQEQLENSLGIPVTVENDVNLVIVDECANGCARGIDEVLLLWLSRGVAAAATVGGRLVRGGRGGAGEIEKVIIPSGGGAASVGELLNRRAVRALGLAHGGSGTGIRAVIRLAVAAGPGFLAELSDRVTAALSAPVALLDPELVILAGDVTAAAGPDLAGAVSDRLGATLAHRPRIVLGSGAGASVRQGAVHAAVRAAQEKVFGRGLTADGQRRPAPDSTYTQAKSTKER